MEFGHLTGSGDLEIHSEQVRLRLSAPIGPRTRALLTMADGLPTPRRPVDPAVHDKPPTCADTVRTDNGPTSADTTDH